MSFVGGKLKLKGGESLKPGGGVKKKKKEKDLAVVSRDPGQEGDKEDAAAARTHKAIHGYAIEQDASTDSKTEAERKWEDRFKKVEEAKLKTLAVKSHKDRVKDFNEYLANLSEHHDIPKVGPG